MRLCPKCHSLAYFNSYFDSFMCNSCEHMWKEKRNALSAKVKSFSVKRRSSTREEKVALYAK